MHRGKLKGKLKFRPGQISPRVTEVRKERESRRTDKTGWDNLSDWYKGWAAGGHHFHKQFALPVMREVLELKRGMRVLDIGCGAGVLRPQIEKAGCEYVGVDKSTGMIKAAKRDAEKDGSRAMFFVSDSALPNGIALPPFAIKNKFDRVTFLFSIQDIDNHRDAIKNVAKLLKPNGEILIFMLHPAFRIPRTSGWGKDVGRKLTYRRVDRYKTEVTIPLPQRVSTERGGNSQEVTSFFYHRPLESYAAALRAAGLFISELREVYSGQTGPDAEFPHFLMIRATLQK